MDIHISEETAQQVFSISRDALIHMVDDHTLAVQAWLSSRAPNAEIFQGKGVRVSSTGFKIPFLNLALGSKFPKDMDEKEIGAEIETVKLFFAHRNVPWYWWMNTSPSPKNIGAILEKHGLAYDAPPLPAMAASLKQDAANFPAFPENIKVWAAKSVNDLRAASKIRRTAFKFREGEALTYFEDMASDWLDNESVQLFLAGETEAQPVSIGAMIFGVDIPGVYVMATLPEHHRKGYGKAILTSIMNHAASQGYKMVALTASKAGFGLYSQFGFHHIFDFDFYSIPE